MKIFRQGFLIPTAEIERLSVTLAIGGVFDSTVGEKLHDEQTEDLTARDVKVNVAIGDVAAPTNAFAHLLANVATLPVEIEERLLFGQNDDVDSTDASVRTIVVVVATAGKEGDFGDEESANHVRPIARHGSNDAAFTLRT